MTLIVVKHFNTWAACLSYNLYPGYYQWIQEQVEESDLCHLYEVHSCNRGKIQDYVFSKNPGHRPGPIHVRQFQKLQEILHSTHELHFVPSLYGMHDCDSDNAREVQYGNVTAVRRGLNYNLLNGMVYGELSTTENIPSPAPRAIQSVMVDLRNGRRIQSVALHGIWQEQGKVDSPERDTQTQNITSFVQIHQRAHCLDSDDIGLIVGGDLNLTTACQALEDIRLSESFGKKGGVILNHEFCVENTRTTWYPEHKPSREANFVIVDPRLRVKSFVADNLSPSDHAITETVFFR